MYGSLRVANQQGLLQHLRLQVGILQFLIYFIKLLIVLNARGRYLGWLVLVSKCEEVVESIPLLL